MPLYHYECSTPDCLASEEIHESISEMSARIVPFYCKFCRECSMVKVIHAPRIVSGVNLASKVPHGFRDVLKKIKTAHPLNKIDGELS